MNFGELLSLRGVSTNRDDAAISNFKFKFISRYLLTFIFLLSFQLCCFASPQKSIYSKWPNGPSPETNAFIIGVWFQRAELAQKYKNIGVNTYIGIKKGPTVNNLKLLDQADMELLCQQNELALKNLEDYGHIIIGWTQPDQPDKANEQTMTQNFSQPVEPRAIQKNYEKFKDNDSTRPVFLNLSPGLAWDNYKGRGIRNGRNEDYPQYIKGCDITSFAIYPMAQKDSRVNGKLSFIAQGVSRLKKYSNNDKIVWNFIEASKVNNPKSRLEGDILRSQVWMSIIHGSKGIVYFVHEWSPKLDDASIFNNKKFLSAVREINNEITELAPILNFPNINPENDRLVVKASNEDSKISVLHKRIEGVSYIFAIETRGEQTKATFDFKNLKSDYTAYALDHGKDRSVRSGKFFVWFDPWQVRMYKIVSPVYDRWHRKETTTIGPIKETRN